MLQHILTTTSSPVLQSMTGLNRKEFNQLVLSFGKAWDAEQEARWENIQRQRKAGGGRKGVLHTIEEKLLFILFYIRHYPVQRLQAILFGMNKTQANRWILRLLPMLEQALGYEVALPLRPGATMEELLKLCPELFFWIDGTERPIPRPKDNERQKKYYSEKKTPYNKEYSDCEH
jgi:hypothetical protein